MTIPEIFYLVCVMIFTFTAILYWNKKKQYDDLNVEFRELKKKEDELIYRETELKNKSKKRQARYVSKNWHNVHEKEEYEKQLKEHNKMSLSTSYNGNPPKKYREWDIIYIIEEKEKVNGSSRFEVVSLTSTDTSLLTPGKFKNYKNRFTKSTAGWIKHDDENLKWLIDKTKKENRNDVIDDILDEN